VDTSGPDYLRPTVESFSTASAQGGCKAFGKNIAGLATMLGPEFGQTASESAPLDDTVELEQQTLCGS
jgi:hypothetical protein